MDIMNQNGNNNFQNDFEKMEALIDNQNTLQTGTLEYFENTPPKSYPQGEVQYYKDRIKAYLNEHQCQTNYENFLEKLEEPIRILDTKMKGLNNILNGGITYGKLYTIGADTSIGKTAFSLQLVKALASQGFPCLYFALEMDTPELDAILLSNHSYNMAIEKGLNLTSITNNGDYNESLKEYNLTNGFTLTRQDAFSSLLARQLKNITNEQTAFLKEVKEDYKRVRNNIFLLDREEIKRAYKNPKNPLINASTIRAIAEVFIEAFNIRPFIVIDYLQLLDYGMENRILNTSQNVIDLKEMTLALKTPVLAISSLNRAGSKQPIQMESFKESGNIEFTADIVLGIQLLYFEKIINNLMETGMNERKIKLKINGYYENALTPKTRDLEIISLKNRQGERYQKLDIKYTPAYNDIEISSVYSLKNASKSHQTRLINEHKTRIEGITEEEENNAEREEQEEKNNYMQLLDSIKNVRVNNSELKAKQDYIKKNVIDFEDWSEVAKHSRECVVLSFKISEFYKDNVNKKQYAKYKGTIKVDQMAKGFLESFYIDSDDYLDASDEESEGAEDNE